MQRVDIMENATSKLMDWTGYSIIVTTLRRWAGHKFKMTDARSVKGAGDATQGKDERSKYREDCLWRDLRKRE